MEWGIGNFGMKITLHLIIATEIHFGWLKVECKIDCTLAAQFPATHLVAWKWSENAGECFNYDFSHYSIYIPYCSYHVSRGKKSFPFCTLSTNAWRVKIKSFQSHSISLPSIFLPPQYPPSPQGKAKTFSNILYCQLKRYRNHMPLPHLWASALLC